MPQKQKAWKIAGFGTFFRQEVKLRGTHEAVATVRFEQSSGCALTEEQLTEAFSKVLEGFKRVIAYQRVSAEQLHLTILTGDIPANQAKDFAKKVVNDVITGIRNLVLHGEETPKTNSSKQTASAPAANRRPRTIRRRPHQLVTTR